MLRCQRPRRFLGACTDSIPVFQRSIDRHREPAWSALTECDPATKSIDQSAWPTISAGHTRRAAEEAVKNHTGHAISKCRGLIRRKHQRAVETFAVCNAVRRYRIHGESRRAAGTQLRKHLTDIPPVPFGRTLGRGLHQKWRRASGLPVKFRNPRD